MKNTVVCVFAHPDDEAFGPAGTIAKFAQNSDVYIICVTKGNNPDSANPRSLGKVRENELKDAARILGVRKVDFLGYDDGCLCNKLYHELAGKIESKLKKYKPDTVITFDIKGVSGHLDHITVSLITTYVFWKLHFIKKLLYFCVTDDVVEKIRDYFIYVPPGYKSSEMDVAVDIEPFWRLKIKAIEAHVSQGKDRKMFLNIFSKLDDKKEYFMEVRK